MSHCRLDSDKSLAYKLKDAVYRGDVIAVKRLLKGGVRLQSLDLGFDSTVLHEAVSIGRLPIVKLLLEHGADVNEPTKNNGTTPLHIVCRSGNVEIAKLLLEHGADINAQTWDGRTALIIAAWKSHEDVIPELLASGANCNIRDNDLWTPLHWAAKDGKTSIAQALIRSGADLNACDKSGRTPLHLGLKHPSLLKLLLHHGADPYIKPKVGSVISLLSQERFSSESLKLLLKAGYSIHKDPWVMQSSWNLSTKFRDEASRKTVMHHLPPYVPSLAAICRHRIRHLLVKCHGGKSLDFSIPELPLPSLLQDYLFFNKEFS